MYSAHTVGSKYKQTENLGTVEIAKRVRQDLKAAYLKPDSFSYANPYKFSVKVRKFAGGSSIDLEVKAAPEEVLIDREKRQALVASLKKVLDAYNYDDSDAMTDYFHVRFYGHVQIDHDLPRPTEAA